MVLNLSSAFPNSLRPNPSDPTPQKESLSESCLKIRLMAIPRNTNNKHLDEFCVTSGKQFFSEITVLGEFVP